ncbi:MAG: hypothetical protein U0797_13100 [Gemmataceae bacterium]
MPAGRLLWPQLGAILAAPTAVIAFLPFLGQSEGSGGDVRSTASAFPRRLFTLPVSSFTLATVPFVAPMLWLAALGLAVVYGLLQPCGVNVPVVVSFLAILTGIGWIHALSWSPFPVRWMRFALLVVVMCGLFTVPVILAESAMPHGPLSALLGGLLALSYPVAVAGVSRGRRGVGVSEPARLDVAEGSATAVDATPFPSPFRAQLWLELRWLGWLAFGLLAFNVFVILPSVHMAEFATRTKPFLLDAMLELGVPGARLGPAWFGLSLMLLIPIAFAFVGAEVSPHLAAKTGTIPLFFAARAVDEPTVVLAKMAGKAVIIGVVWAVVVFVSLAWAAVGGHLGDMMTRLGEYAGAPGPAVAVAGVVLAALANWLFMIGGVWVGLSGRPWVFVVVMVVTMASMVVAAVVAKGWRPEWWPWLVALVAVALASKVITTAWVCRRLLAWRFATAGQLAALVAAWLVIVTPLAIVAGQVFPGGWLMSLAVVQLMPLAQTLAAPLALAWNRHR